MEGKSFPAFPAHAQPTILRVWEEAHCKYDGENSLALNLRYTVDGVMQKEASPVHLQWSYVFFTSSHQSKIHKEYKNIMTHSDE